MDDDARLRRALRAANELPETAAIFDRLRAGMMERWAATPMAASDERERIYLAVTTLNTVQNALRELADDKTYLAAVQEIATGQASVN
jgi:hypothetical protein